MGTHDRPRAATRPATEPHGVPAIEARDLTVERGGRTILDAVDVRVEAGELVVLAGASGSGKTTLLEALAGRRAPAGGAVHLAHHRVGFVPQDDLLHLDLPLGRSLHHAAALTVREPSDSRSRRVDHILSTLDLTGRRSVRVGDLSGGQRKRASIAVELLTEPSIVLLDEPTSGLDPATAADVIGALRRLARTGVTVILTSHHVEDLLAGDRVVFLGPLGAVEYDGPPQGAAAAFGVETLADVYLRLGAAGRSEGARTRPRAPAAAPAGHRRPPGEPPRAAPTPGGAPGPLRQTGVLVRRNAEILTRNRLTLAILVGSPLLVVSMMATLFPGDLGERGVDHPLMPQLMFWMAFAAFFFGLTFGLLQIVEEVPILRREHRAGVGLGPYLASKVVTLLPALAGVVLLLVGVLRTIGRLPPGTDLPLVGALLVEAVAALALGLLASAVVRNAAQAALALPMLCFPQVLFAGAVVPVDDMPLVGRVLSNGLVNRWGFEAVDALLGRGIDDHVPPWAPSAALAALTVVAGAATFAVVRNRCRPTQA